MAELHYLNPDDKPIIEEKLDFDSWIRQEFKPSKTMGWDQYNWNQIYSQFQDYLKKRKPIQFISVYDSDTKRWNDQVDQSIWMHYHIIEYRGNGFFWMLNNASSLPVIVKGILNSGELPIYIDNPEVENQCFGPNPPML